MIGLVCEAVVQILREAFDPAGNILYPIRPDAILVMPDEKVPPYQGDYFVGVYGTDFSPGGSDDNNVAIDATMGIAVTLTRRTAAIPVDRVGSEVYAASFRGMSSVAWKIMTAVSMNPTLFSRVSAMEEYTYLRDLGAQLFEYLRWSSTDPVPIPVYDDHFWARNEHLADPSGYAIMGHTMTVRFRGARAGNLQV